MPDETYNRTQAERALLKAVDTDPRVVAALEAKNSFYDSDAGRHLEAAAASRETWSLLDEDLKDTVEAFNLNYFRTRREVKRELAPRFHPTEIIDEG